MAIERERGISVVTSVMTFEYDGRVFNLLDTPGHEDFSEDTYRTLTAVDSALMVIDAAKGVEPRTIKLMEVTRLRDTPIVTFVNKCDREGRPPLELLDEIEKVLGLACTPITWPVGMGHDFQGVYHLLEDRFYLYTGDKHKVSEIETVDGLLTPGLAERFGSAYQTLRDEIELLQMAGTEFDLERYRAAKLTPVFFGSAVNNFGVRELLDGFVEWAPGPQPRMADTRIVEPDEPKFTGFVFKIQANMDPRHRDRVAFVRLCSGRFERGMKLRHVRSGKEMAVRNPVLFLAQDRELAEEAWAGDILGIPNHGVLRIGDALTVGETLTFTGIPSFAPELLQKVRADDPLRAKHLGRALTHLAEEGAAQVFKSLVGGEWIVGVAGALQFDVLASRIKNEYDLPVRFEGTTLHTARWVDGEPEELKRFLRANETYIAEDHNAAPVYLAPSAYRLKATIEDWPKIRFAKTREHAEA
jgi:peptide chain release factor 3